MKVLENEVQGQLGEHYIGPEFNEWNGDRIRTRDRDATWY
jgi:hypothetical protein